MSEKAPLTMQEKLKLVEEINENLKREAELAKQKDFEYNAAYSDDARIAELETEVVKWRNFFAELENAVAMRDDITADEVLELIAQMVWKKRELGK